MNTTTTFSTIEQLKLQLHISESELETLLRKGVSIDHLALIKKHFENKLGEVAEVIYADHEHVTPTESIILLGSLIDLFVAVKGDVEEFNVVLDVIQTQLQKKHLMPGTEEFDEDLGGVQMIGEISALSGELTASYEDGKSIHTAFA
ncbi:hypothetical protein KC571_01230 [candidate division WWE3 bacterium]|uniref:Uncharacterized protein n=1 Tax=candidate division WWE3 bacterium TaxID=2053526 RepID=A0A955RPX8_UNCKA|nr:hypothetical protein [candidate division WWE3 bacterium]